MGPADWEVGPVVVEVGQLEAGAAEGVAGVAVARRELPLVGIVVAGVAAVEGQGPIAGLGAPAVAGGAAHAPVRPGQWVAGPGVVEAGDLELRVVDVVAVLTDGAAELPPVGVLVAVDAGLGGDGNEGPVDVALHALHVGVLAVQGVVGRRGIGVVEDVDRQRLRLPVLFVVAGPTAREQRPAARGGSVGVVVAADAGALQAAPGVRLGVALVAGQGRVRPPQGEPGGLVVEVLGGQLDHLEVGAAVVGVTALALLVAVGVEAPPGLHLLGDAVMAREAAVGIDARSGLVALGAVGDPLHVGVRGRQRAGADEPTEPLSLGRGWAATALPREQRTQRQPQHGEPPPPPGGAEGPGAELAGSHATSMLGPHLGSCVACVGS